MLSLRMAIGVGGGSAGRGREKLAGETILATAARSQHPITSPYHCMFPGVRVTGYKCSEVQVIKIFFFPRFSHFEGAVDPGYPVSGNDTSVRVTLPGRVMGCYR